MANSGDGRLREIIDAACEAEGVTQKALTVLAVQHDPYRLDTDTHHRNGCWIAEQLSRFYGPTKQTHWRGLHYSIIMAKTKIRKPDGQVYRNTDEDWIWLSERAGKAARWLGYIPFDRIIDRRNSEPIIHRAEKVEPRAAIVSDIDSVEFPDDIEPAPAALGFVARQAFAFACFGEKASLEEICLPWAIEHEADLYLGTGETSDTLLYQIARDATSDGRPLVVFTLTDCDPSGWQMLISIARKLQALQDMLFPGLRWEIVQVALTPEQVGELDLAQEPIKAGDKRAQKWKAAFGVDQTELDALTTPEMTERGILRQMLDEAIAPYLDAGLDRRVAQAKSKWYRQAVAAIDEQIDAEEVERVRGEVEHLQQQLESAKDDLREACAGIELPEVKVPEPKIDVDRLDDKRLAASIVYRFLSLDSRSYVGSVQDGRKRADEGIGRSNQRLEAAFTQYPPETWVYEVLEHLPPGCSEQTLREAEQRHIDRLRSWLPEFGFNIAPAVWDEDGPMQRAVRHDWATTVLGGGA